MKGRHAICIVVDGLRASALGTYGNTSYPTPQFDALAARSLVVEWLWADSPTLQGFYRSVWQGEHALREPIAGERISLPMWLSQSSVRQWLVTDDPWLSQRSADLPLDEALLLETHADHPAEQIEDTTIAQLFSLTVERLAQWHEDVSDDETDSLVWLHTRGLFGPWDAPQSLRTKFLEEGDPPPTDDIKPPAEIRQVDDPDLLLVYRVAYAAQVAVLDACVGAFISAVEESFADSETLVMLLGSRGFALGEHGSIGGDCQELFSERLHLPWLLHKCGNTLPVPRYSHLAQPADVGATLADWFAVKAASRSRDGVSLAPPLHGKRAELRELAVTKGIGGEQAVRTQDWMLRSVPPPKSADNGADRVFQLYAKPDDRWECNDVAIRCPEEVAALREIFDNFRQQCGANEPLPRQLP